MTADGPFAFARGGTGGTASAITGAGLKLALERDDIGGLKAPHADRGRPASATGSQIARDDDGRITRRTETVDGATHTYDYRYDADGQLLEVERDAGTPQAAVVERYAYDAQRQPHVRAGSTAGRSRRRRSTPRTA